MLFGLTGGFPYTKPKGTLCGLSPDEFAAVIVNVWLPGANEGGLPLQSKGVAVPVQVTVRNTLPVTAPSR